MAKIRLDELAILAKNGDEDAMRRIYAESRGILRSMANLYFMVGADRDDVIQEGMIGLFSAIRTFDPAAGASFKTFSELCIKRRIINAVKMADRKKHKPLNESVSIDAPSYENRDGIKVAGEDSLEDMLHASKESDPEEIVLLSELLDYVEKNAPALFSEMEHTVWRAYSRGEGIPAIAARLGRSYKSVENTITRIKGKIEKLISAY